MRPARRNQERPLSQFLEMKVMLSSRGDLIIGAFHLV
jgi:hypothetical protein